MNWEIIYYRTGTADPIHDFIDSQPPKARAKLIRNLLLLEEFGLDIGFPLVSNVGRNLWELRTVFQGQQYRILFSIASGRIILLLSGFGKKNQKIPASQLDLADFRLKEYLRREDQR